MDIKYFENKEIDKDKWDKTVAKSFNGIVYGYSWYLDSVCESWDALIEGDYERIFPMPFKTKLGINIIYQPFFTQQLGVFSRKILNEEIVISFIKAIPSKFKVIDLLLNTHNKVVSSKKINVETQLNHELDLIHSFHQIENKYSKNLKRNLKKAILSQNTIVKNVSPDDIIQLFRQNRGTDIKHLGDKDYNHLKRIVYTGIHRGLVDIYGVTSPKNELIAGAIFIRSNHKSTFLFSGLDDEGRKHASMPLILNSYFNDHANKQLTFDFDGSNNTDLARFYKSFGSTEVNYSRISINRLNPLLKILYSLYRKF